MADRNLQASPARGGRNNEVCAYRLLGCLRLAPGAPSPGRAASPLLRRSFALSGFDLRELGWNDELAEQLEPGHVPGRVAAAHRGAFDVWTEAASVRTRLPGRAMHEGLDVGVGDWV